MKLTAKILFPVILTLGRQEKERLFKMIKFDLDQELIESDTIVNLKSKSIQYLINHFDRAYQRNKHKNSFKLASYTTYKSLHKPNNFIKDFIT